MSDHNFEAGNALPEKRAESWMPTLAGVLDICASLSCLIGALVLGFIGSAAFGLPRNLDEPVPTWPFDMGFGLLTGLSLLLFVLGALGVIGGIHALRRSSWSWAVVGAIAATLCCFPLGIAAIVLTVMSENELNPRHA